MEPSCLPDSKDLFMDFCIHAVDEGFIRISLILTSYTDKVTLAIHFSYMSICSLYGSKKYSNGESKKIF